MPQYARPDSDLSVLQWVICSTCAGGLYQQIDEVIPDDGDFIETVPNPQSATYLAGLSNVTDPVVDTGHVVRYRFRKDEASASRLVNLTVTLLQGNTAIATFSHVNIPATITQADQPLTAAQAASITDYTDLRLQFVADSTGTGQARSAIVTWAELEVPDAPETTTTTTSSTTTTTTTTTSTSTSTTTSTSTSSSSTTSPLTTISTTTTTLPLQLVGTGGKITRNVETLDVILSRVVQASGTLTVPVSNLRAALAAPSSKTLLQGSGFQITSLRQSSTVTPDAVSSLFLMTVEITLNGAPISTPSPLVIEIEDTERCPGAGVGPGETVVQLHDVQPQIEAVISESSGSFQLVLWATVHYCLVVSKKTILRVQVLDDRNNIP